MIRVYGYGLAAATALVYTVVLFGPILWWFDAPRWVAPTIYAYLFRDMLPIGIRVARETWGDRTEV